MGEWEKAHLRETIEMRIPTTESSCKAFSFTAPLNKNNNSLAT